MRILLVEDDRMIGQGIVNALKDAAYAVDWVTDGATAVESTAAETYDLILLDLGLPQLEGLEVLRSLRPRKKVPVIIVTARDEVDDRVTGLDLGADDYLVKPFALEELLARLRAVIRRRYGAAANLVTIADLVIDDGARTVKRGGQAVSLSAREFALLEYLALRRGQVVTRTEIWEHVYDFAAEPSSNVVDVYVGYLRRKLGDGEGGAPRLIRTHRGLGYSLEGPEVT